MYYTVCNRLSRRNTCRYSSRFDTNKHISYIVISTAAIQVKFVSDLCDEFFPNRQIELATCAGADNKQRVLGLHLRRL